jgi:hypothetical protein
MQKELYEQIGALLEAADAVAVEEYEDDLSSNPGDTVKVFMGEAVCVEVRDRLSDGSLANWKPRLNPWLATHRKSGRRSGW